MKADTKKVVPLVIYDHGERRVIGDVDVIITPGGNIAMIGEITSTDAIATLADKSVSYSLQVRQDGEPIEAASYSLYVHQDGEPIEAALIPPMKVVLDADL